MLSTLSSFLPPALQLGGSQDKALRPSVDEISHPQQHVQTQSPTEMEHKIDGAPQSAGVDERGAKKKKERTHESFIVVRPPPSKSNHPLNLQVQLVPPSSRAPLPRTSFSSGTSPFSPTTPTTDPGSASTGPDSPLARTTSNRSDVSAYSALTSFSTASTSSFSSMASTSTSSTSGGRRMIIPLYNLQAHNVMTNVIVDAGTDAKIAKFHKKGLEIIGLAMLEVVEVARGASWLEERSVTGHGQPCSHTPASSHVSLNSETTQESPPLSHQYHQSTPLSPQQTPQPEKSGARRLFGKVFKKKDGNVVSPSMNSPYLHTPGTPRSPHNSLDRDAANLTPKAVNKRSSLLLAAAPNHSPVPSGSDQQTASAIVTPQQTVLGIQPTIHGGLVGPEGIRPRPTRYVWVIRKWLKGPPSGITLPSIGMAPGQSILDGLLEVRLEWSRAPVPVSRKSKDHERREAKREKRRSTSHQVPSNTPSLSSLKKRGQASESRGRRSADGEHERRERGRSPESVHTATTATTEDASPLRPGDDEDEDSDPEDSETPWTCHIVVRRLYNSQAQRLSQVQPEDGSAPAASAVDVRAKVAAVVPAPHHPKVVSLLKIPFPLPDIIITSKSLPHPHHLAHLHPHLSLRPHSHDIEIEVEARKRVVTPSGVARPNVGQGMNSPPATPTQAAITSSASQSGGLGRFAGKFKTSMSPALPSHVSSHTSLSTSSSEGSNVANSTITEAVVLSAEEIKDVVCCTALWVVVREGFGGVGKVSRKGDGWRIRG